jgi:hypothetical protein
MMGLKRVAAGATIAGMLGFAAVGLSTAVAGAAPVLPNAPATPWVQDHHGHGWGGGDGDGGGDWGDGGWGGGPGWGAPGPFGCISGPVGIGWGVGCI